MSGHAKLSPSGAHRWMVCPGSVVLEADYPDTGSVYADEGTAAHTLASWVLEDGTPAADFIGEVIRVGERQFKVDEDMARYVADYAKLVRSYAEGGSLMVEQRVPIDHLTSEDGAGGTSDAVILSPAQETLFVVDLKYGMGVKVDAQDNPQLMMYALGALHEFGLLCDVSYVTMVIHQPRLNHVSEWNIPVHELEAFGDMVRVAATNVNDAHADGAKASHFAREYLSPGEKQCRFCKAKASCPALKAEVMDVVHEAATLDDFADLLPLKPGSLTGDNYLSQAMAKVGLVEDWCKAIRAEVERRLLLGKEVDGFKLVEGKRGPRKWSDPEAVENLFKSFRMRQDEMYDLSLISPTSAEKVFKENPKRWAKVQDHITQSSGKVSVAPATDKRQAIVVQSVAEDFRDLVTEEVEN